MTLILYELCNASGKATSPYCLRISNSLQLLSLPFESRLIGLTEIEKMFNGSQKTVPVLVDGKQQIGGSWKIAEYLAENYDLKKQLFGGKNGCGSTRFITNWVDATVVGAINRIIVKDVHDTLQSEDQEHFRRNEEKRFGKTLEELHSTRLSAIPALQTGLHPARQAIKLYPFLTGDQPTYADFALYGTFVWARFASDFELLKVEDRVREWIARMDDWLMGSD